LKYHELKTLSGTNASIDVEEIADLIIQVRLPVK